ncbi:molybdopterin adenylyltransferase [Olivibacter sp. XZL3]|uniref:molybdopterin adenylyltransferase n=1 Tax=Olivibacter sp. XZL3 TaxID=1735116 RepID=UPI001064F250|nr:molybdopterin adenylyltransferase [Olivibacter sp. XZL3]
MKEKTIKIGIITVSDRASNGVYNDISGKEIIRALRSFIVQEWSQVYRIVPDEQVLIEKNLIQLIDKEGCCLVVTTGGTGPSLRDVTPEATESVCNKMLPGFGELMRKISLRKVPTAILSRQTAGIRNNSLIVNLPGKPSSILTCLRAVFPAIPYCIELLGGPHISHNEKIVKVFRPSGG